MTRKTACLELSALVPGLLENERLDVAVAGLERDLARCPVALIFAALELHRLQGAMIVSRLLRGDTAACEAWLLAARSDLLKDYGDLVGTLVRERLVDAASGSDDRRANDPLGESRVVCGDRSDETTREAIKQPDSGFGFGLAECVDPVGNGVPPSADTS